MLAVVIPYYNFQYFNNTLSCLSRQTDKRFKVYIGNDCSPNNPEEVIQKYTSLLNLKYIEFETNIGQESLVAQWERCIDLIEGEEWLMVLGDDDVLEDNFVESFYVHLKSVKKRNYHVIRYASQYINEDGVPLDGYSEYKHPVEEKSTDAFYRHAIGQSRSSLSEYIFSRETYNKNKFKDYPLAWHSDDHAWLAFTNFKIIYSINESVVSIRVSSNSISGKKDNIRLKNQAKNMFYSFLTNDALCHFTKEQKTYLLLQYVEVLKENQLFTFFMACRTSLKLIKAGSLISGLKVVNRFIKLNYKN